MLIELAPLEETAMGKELIQQGVQVGQVEILADLIAQKFGVSAAVMVLRMLTLENTLG